MELLVILRTAISKSTNSIPLEDFPPCEIAVKFGEKVMI